MGASKGGKDRVVLIKIWTTGSEGKGLCVLRSIIGLVDGGVGKRRECEGCWRGRR